MADITTSRIVYNNEGPPIQANGFIRIDSSGGTDNYYLELYEAGAQRFRIYENSDNVYFDGGPGNTIFRPRQGGGTNNFLIFGANVGIETTSPGQKLDVAGNVVIRGGGSHLANSGVGELKIGYAYASSGGTAGSATRLAIQPYAHTGGPWVFVARDTSSSAFLDIGYNAAHLTLKHDGKLGIGTSSPIGKLMVQDDTAGSPTRIIVSNGGTVQSGTAARLSFYKGTTEKNYIERRRDGSGKLAFVSPSDDNPFVFENASGEFLRFTGSKIGIGTNSPDFELDVAGSIGIDDYIYHNGDHNTYIRAQADQWTFRTGGSDRMYINNTGVGIGNTNPSQELHVTGDILASGDVIAFSDKKLKENIKTLDGSKVYDMRGVSFTKKDTGKDSSGVIAQEIQKIAPELVTDNDGTLSVAYGNLTGYLIEAVKELKTEVEQLKKQIKNGNNL